MQSRLTDTLLVVLLAGLATQLSQGSEEHEHEHEHEHGHGHGHAFEWVGIFEIPDAGYGHSLVIQRVEGMDADFSMLFLALPADSGDDEGLEAAEEEAEELLETTNATKTSGIDIRMAVGVPYEVSFSNISWVAGLNVRFPTSGLYAIFLEHGMEELCLSGECFRDAAGMVLEPLVSEGGHDHEHHSDGHSDDEVDWGSTMGGTIVVWLVVFSGIVLLGGGCQKYYELSERNVHFISMLAAGALLSTAFCLILLEASHYINTADLTEAELAGTWGSLILLGFLTATIIDVAKEAVQLLGGFSTGYASPEAIKPVHVIHTGNGGTLAAVGTEKEVELCESPGTKGDGASPSQERRVKLVNGLILSIVVGDFFHNFCDGIFIGAAFQSCSNTLGWTIVATTAWHEFAQEIADFTILTKIAGLSIPFAFLVNALSGISVVLGGIVICASSLSDYSIGCLLAFGSGNYIYLAAAELFPSVRMDKGMTVIDKTLSLLLFVVGACAVGLVLLNHEHCSASGDGHDGHDH